MRSADAGAGQSRGEEEMRDPRAIRTERAEQGLGRIHACMGRCRSRWKASWALGVALLTEHGRKGPGVVGSSKLTSGTGTGKSGCLRRDTRRQRSGRFSSKAPPAPSRRGEGMSGPARSRTPRRATTCARHRSTVLRSWRRRIAAPRLPSKARHDSRKRFVEPAQAARTADRARSPPHRFRDARRRALRERTS